MMGNTDLKVVKGTALAKDPILTTAAKLRHVLLGPFGTVLLGPFGTCGIECWDNQFVFTVKVFIYSFVAIFISYIFISYTI